VCLAARGTAAIDEIGEQGKNRKVEGGIDADSDAKKPAERPSERFVSGGHDEFREFQARRKKRDNRNGKRRFARHGQG